jgi:hypothetical protein
LGVPGWGTNSVAVSSGFFHGLALVPPLALRARLSPQGLVVEWTCGGVLQWAPAPSGPYTDIPGCNGVYTNVNTTEPSRFFRLRR